MGYQERAIKEAFDKISGSVLKSNEVFQKQKNAFELRKQYHTGEVDLYCSECRQRLVVATSKLDRLYFRHLPNSEYCTLKDAELSEEEIEGYYTVLRERESDRHKELKNIIGSSLNHVVGVNKTSIVIDTEFIIKGDERRRPDVYCRYNGLELVFEIQLSPLPLRYILGRFEFYRRHGIYLFWILDGTDLRVPSQMERDIKYLSEYQNLFKLDDRSSDLRFLCSYKTPYIHEKGEVWEKWFTRSVALTDITFCKRTIQPFYFNYLQEKADAEKLLKAHLQELRVKEEEEKRKKKREQIESNTIHIIAELKKFNERNYNCYSLYKLLDNLDFEGIELLNCKLALKNRSANGIPAINYYIRNSRPDENSKISIGEFLLLEDRIEIDVNTKESSGRGCLQELFENDKLSAKLYKLLPALFRRRYDLTEYDRTYFENENLIRGYDEDVLKKLNYCNSLSDRSLAPLIIQYFGYLLFIESSLNKRIIGSKLNNWVQYIVRIQGRYKDLWYYSEKILKTTGTWEIVIASDKKGTIEKKIVEFNLRSFGPDYSIGLLLNELYPQFEFPNQNLYKNLPG